MLSWQQPTQFKESILERWADSIDRKLSAIVDLGGSLPSAAHVDYKLEHLISYGLYLSASDDLTGIDIDEIAHSV